MKPFKEWLLNRSLLVGSILVFVIKFCGCSAALVPIVKDPNKKLAWAKELYEDQDRPLPAEKFIREAIDEFQKTNDQFGLATAFRQYGLFFYSNSINHWKKYYEKHGFLDRTATYENRFEKSSEYLQKAEEILERVKKYDVLTNVRLNMGHVFQAMGKMDMACLKYDESIKSYHNNLNENPGAQVVLPANTVSYVTYVDSYKKKINCK